MAEYTARIDGQIAQSLKARGYASPELVAGFTVEEGARLLEQYARLHLAEVDYDSRSGRLVASAPPAVVAAAVPAAPEPPAEPLSPVDQVLAAPVGRSVLDVRSSGGAYPKWTWWLVLGFGLPGALVAWFVVRDTNPQAGKAMLWTGLAVQVLSVAAGLGGRRRHSVERAARGDRLGSGGRPTRVPS